MQKIIRIIIALQIVFLSQGTHAHPVFITESYFEILPETDGSGTHYMVRLNSFFPDPGYGFASEPVLNLLSENSFRIDLPIGWIAEEGMLVPAVVVPFTRTFDLGEPKPGEYTVSANYYLDHQMMGSVEQNFIIQTIAPTAVVPLPPAIILFASGSWVLMLWSKKRFP